MATEVIIGNSPALSECLEYADAVAQSDAAVLILGESGVGKELVAQRIHAQSARARRRLITVNCASVPRELFESEFFGHVKGSFTGATRDRMGRFEAAHRGTLFLDEVGEIPPELQGKLLRALQQQSFERVGDEKTRHVDVRVIAATNRQLVDDVEKNRFRRDLYYRLSTFSIEVPPLRDRTDDVPRLAASFIAQLRNKYRGVDPTMTPQQISVLRAYDWPGNVRELKNVVERAFVLGRAGGRLDFERALSGLGPIARNTDVPRGELSEHRGFLTAKEFDELERDNLIAVMEAAQWRVSGDGGAAGLFGIKPTTLASRLSAHKIDRPRKNSAYWRIGGQRVIAAMSRDLLGRLQSDPQIGRFWINRSNSGLQREEQMLTRFLCAALGGPREYRGKTMVAVHKNLGITSSDWAVFRRHVEATLQALDIAGDFRALLTGMVEDLRPQIVVSS